MSLKIDQGLFNLNFTDYHAILGISVDAEVKEIRKRYHAIARRLHPDSCATEQAADRQRATEFLSKMVNPAYEKLSQERNYNDYCVLLQMKGKQALKQQDTVVLSSDAARRLASASDLDTSYRAALRELADSQYQTLDRVLDITGQISELNLVYLMRKEGKGESIGARAAAAPAPQPAAAPKPAAAAAPVSHESVVAAYLRRAREFEAKQDFPRAIQELRDATKLDRNNSQCHSRLGVIYLKLRQPTMAKIYFDQALKLDPQDAVALEGKQKLESPNGSTTTGKSDAKAAKPDLKGKATQKGGKPNAKESNGGLFGLFGKKK